MYKHIHFYFVKQFKPLWKFNLFESFLKIKLSKFNSITQYICIAHQYLQDYEINTKSYYAVNTFIQRYDFVC